MKLHDWVIQDAIRNGDIFTAVNTAAYVLGLPQYAPDDPVLLGTIVMDRVFPAVPEQIRIVCSGHSPTWADGQSTTFGKWEASGAPHIRIWTDHYEVK